MMQIRRSQIFVVVLLLLVSVYSLLIDMFWIHKLLIILLLASLGWVLLNLSRYGYRKEVLLKEANSKVELLGNEIVVTSDRLHGAWLIFLGIADTVMKDLQMQSRDMLAKFTTLSNHIAMVEEINTLINGLVDETSLLAN